MKLRNCAQIAQNALGDGLCFKPPELLGCGILRSMLDCVRRHMAMLPCCLDAQDFIFFGFWCSDQEVVDMVIVS